MEGSESGLISKYRNFCGMTEENNEKIGSEFTISRPWVARGSVVG
jgi:hypothetical protein